MISILRIQKEIRDRPHARQDKEVKKNRIKRIHVPDRRENYGKLNRYEGTENYECSLRDVEYSLNSENERKADRRESEKPTLQDAADNGLKEIA